MGMAILQKKKLYLWTQIVAKFGPQAIDCQFGDVRHHHLNRHYAGDHKNMIIASPRKDLIFPDLLGSA